MTEASRIDITDLTAQRQALESCSHYAKILLHRFPEYSEWLWTQGAVHKRYSLLDIHREFQREIGEGKSLFEISRAMRRVKQKHFLRLALRDLIGLDDVEASTGQLSDLAYAAFQTAYLFLERFPEAWGGMSLVQKLKSGNLSLAVIGLGKLGGHELNFVSDVDIMFVYEIQSATSDDLVLKVRALLPGFCQAMVKIIDDMIDGDRLFKVDLRLRPGGKDSELVIPLPFAIHHYLVEGQSWERFALIKAHPVAGDISLGNYLIRETQPFVYRRFLDFQTIDEIKRMRDRILSETPFLKPGPGYNVKLGEGGIREIEFIVQALQVIYGGRRPELRETNTLKGLRKLAEADILPQDVALGLSKAYEFLRRTEHWIQLAENVQSHRIPKSKASIERLVRAVMRLHPSDDPTPYVDAFMKQLLDYTEFVHHQFRSLFAEAPAAVSDAHVEDIGDSTDEDSTKNSNFIKAFIADWATSRKISGDRRTFVSLITSKSSSVVRELPPSFPVEEAANRIIRFAEAALRRPGLVKFFLSTGKSYRSDFALETALKALIRSPFVGNILAHLPGLAESLSDSLKDFAKWALECDEIIESASVFEEKIQWLRRFKNERLLAIAVRDIIENPGHETVEKELTDLAEYFIQRTYKITCQKAGLDPEEYPLCICALGKLGSKEMSYHSDLDLVFVFSPEFAEHGDNLDRIPEETVKLVQRFVRLLSINLEEGPGYEVDMRLRPSGNYGPLVVTKRAWEEYYENQADPWEYASLVRFRPVAGNRGIGKSLVEKVVEILSIPRDPEVVWSRLCELRSRMETERLGEVPDRKALHIKLGSGGLADIEFWCQGTIVVWNRPSWKPGTPTARLFPEVLKIWNVDASEAGKLVESFGVLKGLEHRIALADPEGRSGWLGPEEWEMLESHGLLPFKERELSLADVRRSMSLIRRWWNRVCDEKSF